MACTLAVANHKLLPAARHAPWGRPSWRRTRALREQRFAQAPRGRAHAGHRGLVAVTDAGSRRRTAGDECRRRRCSTRSRPSTSAHATDRQLVVRRLNAGGGIDCHIEQPVHFGDLPRGTTSPAPDLGLAPTRRRSSWARRHDIQRSRTEDHRTTTTDPRHDLTRVIRASRGSELNERAAHQRRSACCRTTSMPEVAESPQDLVVYGGIGSAARNWAMLRPPSSSR